MTAKEERTFLLKYSHYWQFDLHLAKGCLLSSAFYKQKNIPNIHKTSVFYHACTLSLTFIFITRPLLKLMKTSLLCQVWMTHPFLVALGENLGDKNSNQKPSGSFIYTLRWLHNKPKKWKPFLVDYFGSLSLNIP